MSPEDIMRIIDGATEPVRMSPTEALEFLEQIETEIQSRKEALRDEIQEQE